MTYNSATNAAVLMLSDPSTWPSPRRLPSWVVDQLEATHEYVRPHARGHCPRVRGYWRRRQ